MNKSGTQAEFAPSSLSWRHDEPSEPESRKFPEGACASSVPALFSSSSAPAASGSLARLRLLGLPRPHSRPENKLPSGPVRSPPQPGSAPEREGMLRHSPTPPAIPTATLQKKIYVCLNTQSSCHFYPSPQMLAAGSVSLTSC